MRRKATCTGGHAEAGEVTALLIAQLDLTELVVLDGADGLADDVAGAAAAQGYEPRVRAGGWADAAGADLVVVTRSPATPQPRSRRAGRRGRRRPRHADPVGDAQRLLDGHAPVVRARVLGAPGRE